MRSKKAIMTDCAARKFKRYCGMNRNRARQQATHILRYGISHKEATGELCEFMNYLYFRCGTNNTRLYGNTAYLFDGQAIISHYILPDRLVPLVKKMTEEKRERIDGKPKEQHQKELHIPDRPRRGLTPMPWQR